MAAPTAPPSVFARTAEAAAPTPAPSPTPVPVLPALAPVPGPKPAPPAPANPIRIGLGRSQSIVDLTAPGGIAVVAAGVIQWQSAPNQAVRLTLSGTQILVAGLAKPLTGPVRLVPVQPEPSNVISYNRKPYRGEFEVLVNTKDKRLSVVNVLNLDDYLMGVVPKEMPTSWPAEALKAQAVAARTYAILNKGKYNNEGFDMTDTTMDQAYGGLAGEKPSSNGAVAATAGQVLTYAGKLAGTYYHSSSGGHTENNEIIFQSAPIPYLRGVEDYDNVPGNTKYSWTYTYTPDEFAKQLASASAAIGPVVGAEPAGVIGSSGRPSRWSLKGVLSSITLTAEQVRWAFGLPSSVRTITVKTAQPGNGDHIYQPGEQVYAVGANGVTQARNVQDSTVVGASGVQQFPADGVLVAHGPAGQSGGTSPTPTTGAVEVTGGGYGHAVGMSQWGAYGMATQGKSYAEILTHFYQGTKVEVR
ncbi:MAG: spoIID [Firmicutes bacterium]|nr:spoIID [Bacillota bacterium]